MHCAEMLWQQRYNLALTAASNVAARYPFLIIGGYAALIHNSVMTATPTEQWETSSLVNDAFGTTSCLFQDVSDVTFIVFTELCVSATFCVNSLHAGSSLNSQLRLVYRFRVIILASTNDSTRDLVLRHLLNSSGHSRRVASYENDLISQFDRSVPVICSGGKVTV
jgi:hypothetical protein